MKVLVVAVGAVKGALAPVVADYERRAGHYWKIEVSEVAAGTKGGSQDAQAVKAAEGERLLARIPAGFEVVAMTRDGKSMDSRKLAGYLEEHAIRATAGVAFIIGGAFGLDSSVLARAQRRLALSQMTLPHEVARLVLSEQLYRAGTILRGEPYHKG